MRTLEISSASLEYVRVPVFAKESGAVVNPTSDVVTMAFLTADADPAGGDWKAAVWETDTTTTPDTYYAKCLIGTGGTAVLANGRYQVWVKVTDSPEIPVKPAGLLVVT